MTATALPAVIDALISAFTTALAATPVKVADGAQPGGWYDGGEVVVVGFGDQNNPIGRSTRVPLEGASTLVTETVYVNCALFTPSGGTAKQARDTLASRLDLIDAAVRSARLLGGVTADALVAPDIEFHVADAASGEAAYVQFAVVATAYI